MTAIKTSELAGPALDWAVLRALGHAPADILIGTYGPLFGKGYLGVTVGYGKVFSPSTNWAQGGPIIERNDICLGKTRNGREYVAWIGCASDFGLVRMYFGPTKLVAAMRCCIASKLGAEIEIPEELK